LLTSAHHTRMNLQGTAPPAIVTHAEAHCMLAGSARLLACCKSQLCVLFACFVVCARGCYAMLQRLKPGSFLC
jgi:hypothetical protein